MALTKSELKMQYKKLIQTGKTKDADKVLREIQSLSGQPADATIESVNKKPSQKKQDKKTAKKKRKSTSKSIKD